MWRFPSKLRFKCQNTDLTTTHGLCSPEQVFSIILVPFVTSVPSGVTSFIKGFLSLGSRHWSLPLLSCFPESVCLIRRAAPGSGGPVAVAVRLIVMVTAAEGAAGAGLYRSSCGFVMIST